MHNRLIPSIVVVVLLASAVKAQSQPGGFWESPFGTTLNGAVRSFAFGNDGSVYIAGDFTEAGGLTVNRVARWNGSSWEALGTGVDNRVNTIAIVGEYVYAGGMFQTAGNVVSPHIARWNGIKWEAVGGGLSGWVNAMTVRGNELYVGGWFSGELGSSQPQLNGIARWDGASWHQLGDGLDTIGFERYSVLSLTADSGYVYVGGTFKSASGVETPGVARWDDQRWSGLGAGVDGSVRALYVNEQGIVYAAGNFTIAGDQPAQNIARWDGLVWEALGQGLILQVNSLAIISGNLYAGGTHLIGSEAEGYHATAQWTGFQWESLGSGFDGMFVDVLGMASFGNKLYVGGGFSLIGGLHAQNVATWNTGLPTSNARIPDNVIQGTYISNLYPNPVSAKAYISINVVIPGHSNLIIYDALGRVIEVLLDSELPAGQHKLVWDAARAPSGVYYIRLSTIHGIETRLLNLIK